jgi:predicted RNase H-like nuclease (RuvC/YqgF family)
MPEYNFEYDSLDDRIRDVEREVDKIRELEVEVERLKQELIETDNTLYEIMNTLDRLEQASYNTPIVNQETSHDQLP